MGEVSAVLAIIGGVVAIVSSVLTAIVFVFRSGRQLAERDRRLESAFEDKLTALRKELEEKVGAAGADSLEALEARVTEKVREVMQDKHDATMEAQRAAMTMQRNEQAHSMEIVHERLTKMAHADKNRAAENAALAAKMQALPTAQQFAHITARIEGVAASQRETKVMLEQISESLHREREAVLQQQRKGK